MHHRYTPMKYVVTIALAGTLLSCASPSNTTKTAPAPSPTGEGLSFATAIRVPSATERDGITWERIYLAHHYRGRLVGQRLGNHAGRVYDIMTIATPDGRQQDVYFDISSYVGHF
jgi:hypothetical protein